MYPFTCITAPPKTREVYVAMNSVYRPIAKENRSGLTTPPALKGPLVR